MVKPYKQIKIRNIIFRIFYKKEDENLHYKWHTDDRDRYVFFLPLGKWYIQFNNMFPENLSPFCIYKIPKKLYHRLIYKIGVLFCIIFEK